MSALRLLLLLVAAVAAALVLPAQDPTPKLEVLRFSGIPDSDKKDLSKQYEVVSAYLAKELGLRVEFVNVPDYNGAVTALAANKIDFAWLGGVTAVQSEERTRNAVTFVAARDTDLAFKSYFVVHESLVESGRFKRVESLDYGTLDQLRTLAPAFKQSSFTFGEKLSTSGHFMPRHFLGEAGLDPETTFASKPGFQLQGGHAATLKAVASGAFDVGVLNYASWEKAEDATKAAAPVVAVSPAFVDYCWVAHNRVGKDAIASLRKAFVQLDAKNPAHQPVLKVFSASKFVNADPKLWDGVRAVMKAARERGVVE